MFYNLAGLSYLLHLFELSKTEIFFLMYWTKRIKEKYWKFIFLYFARFSCYRKQLFIKGSNTNFLCADLPEQTILVQSKPLQNQQSDGISPLQCCRMRAESGEEPSTVVYHWSFPQTDARRVRVRMCFWECAVFTLGLQEPRLLPSPSDDIFISVPHFFFFPHFNCQCVEASNQLLTELPAEAWVKISSYTLWGSGAAANPFGAQACMVEQRQKLKDDFVM